MAARVALAQRFERELEQHGQRLQRRGELFDRVRGLRYHDKRPRRTPPPAPQERLGDDDDKESDESSSEETSKVVGDDIRASQSKLHALYSARSTQAAQGTAESVISEIGFKSPASTSEKASNLSISSVLRAATMPEYRGNTRRPSVSTLSQTGSFRWQDVEMEAGYYGQQGPKVTVHHHTSDESIDSLVESMRTLTAAQTRPRNVGSFSSTIAAGLDDSEDILDEDFVTVNGLSVSSISSSQVHRVDHAHQLVMERLAQLESEEKHVLAYLKKLRAGDEADLDSSSSARDRAEHFYGSEDDDPRSDRARFIERPLLVEGPNNSSAQEINKLLSPILEEHLELTNTLRQGARMLAVLSRGATQNDSHLCTEVFVRLSAQLDTLCWTLEFDDLASSTDQYSKRGMPVSSMRRAWEEENTFRLPLREIRAIFCGGKHEERAMDVPADTIFRLHVARKSVMPIQFAAPSPAECQTWVTGLTLFSELFAKSTNSNIQPPLPPGQLRRQ